MEAMLSHVKMFLDLISAYLCSCGAKYNMEAMLVQVPMTSRAMLGNIFAVFQSLLSPVYDAEVPILRKHA